MKHNEMQLVESKETHCMYETRRGCVSFDSASFVIYPEIKATEATFAALGFYAVAFISG